MKDTEQLLTLYHTCFPDDPDNFWHWFFQNVYRSENTLCIRENDLIIASLQMIPCTLALYDQRFDAHYIYAAATMPEHRGKGLMALLLAQAAEKGILQGHDYSVLITQEDSLLGYYARFGYEPCLLYEQKNSVERSCTGEVQPMNPEDIAAVDWIYRAAVSGTLHGVRSRDHWQKQLELFQNGAWVLKDKGNISAYAFSDERGVLEACGTDADALCAAICPGRSWRTVPAENGIPMGSIKPLNGSARKIMEQNRCFLNLMYN